MKQPKTPNNKHGHISQIATDGMPSDVALEILTGKEKQTSAIKRSAMESRQKVFISTQEPKKYGHKIKQRLQKLPLMKLDQLFKRCHHRANKIKNKLPHILIPSIREQMEQVFMALTFMKREIAAEVDRRKLVTQNYPMKRVGLV